MTENRFYVYTYLRADGTAYYVGKGCGNRRWQKSRRKVPLPADSSRNIIYKNNLTETAALALEVELIASYGRKDLGTGILRNLTDGGEGVSEYRHTEERKQKISDANKGENNPCFGRTGEKNPMFGRTGENHPTSKLSDAQRQEIRDLRAANPKYWTHRRLAKKFGVSLSTIRRILK